MVSVFLDDDVATENFGRQLAMALPNKALIFLNGPLGAGKTTLVRGVLRALGHLGSTKSPTYTLVEPYQTETKKLYHFDLYRLSDPEELEYIGIRDYLDESALCLIEWPNQGAGFLPVADLDIQLDYECEGRRLQIKAGGAEWAQELVAKFGDD